ncbi:PTS sugar transporter subunit IIA [Erysipelothrix sp. Poltava]|nr:PTS sugar transporter subunit IIA [Erysipelothrix sp. Poltava]
MIGIIVTGHGRFAEGLSSSVELIAGAQPQYKSVLFLEESGPEKLSSDLKEAIAEVNTGEGVLVFTDLKGGTPFKESVMIAMNHTDVHVLAGTNLPMLLEARLNAFKRTCNL